MARCSVRKRKVVAVIALIFLSKAIMKRKRKRTCRKKRF